MTVVPRIAVIVASTRGNRFAEYPLEWVSKRLAARPDVDGEIIDLLDYPLPFYDLPVPPAKSGGVYTTDAERVLGERFAAVDGYLVLTNEYNHGYSAALKNALDHYFVEFRHKPIGFVGYGNVGGSRAIEQLRQVSAELDMVSVRHSVHLLGAHMTAIRGGAAREATFAALDPSLDLLADDLAWWGRALHDARERDRAADDAHAV